MSFPQSRLTFLRGHSSLTQLLFYGLFSLALMVVDHRFQEPLPLRQWLQQLAMPVQLVVDLPVNVIQGLHFLFSTRAWLAKENERLLQAHTLLSGELLRFRALERENEQLHELLLVSLKHKPRMMVGKPVDVATDQVSEQIVLDKGTRDGVYVGQPVVDAKGVVGVVLQTNLSTSRVLLLTDPSHGIPAQILRNGVRVIAEGNGANSLLLQHVSETVDIQVNDILVTSGLGGRFTAGYPVGIVHHISRQVGQPFLQVDVRPLAALDRVQPMLLLFEDDAS